jgi:hypothetical protein
LPAIITNSLFYRNLRASLRDLAVGLVADRAPDLGRKHSRQSTVRAPGNDSESHVSLLLVHISEFALPLHTPPGVLCSASQSQGSAPRFGSNGLSAGALAAASLGLHIAMDYFAVQQTILLVGPFADVLSQASAPCHAHKKKALSRTS